MFIEDKYNLYERQVDTDFRMFGAGSSFPSLPTIYRNRKARFQEDKLLSGQYGNGVTLEIMVTDAFNKNKKVQIPYNVLTINKFKLFTEKLVSLIFGVGDIDVKGSNDEITVLLRKLVEKTHWLNSIKDVVTKISCNGNCILRTYEGGANCLSMTKGFKIVDEHDITKTKALVIYEELTDEKGLESFVRVELHTKGYMAERVYKYTKSFESGLLGDAVEYNYRGRTIPAEGKYYTLDFDEVAAAEWVSINEECHPTKVYGTSPYNDFANLVFKLEELLSIESMVIETNAKPILAVATKLIQKDEKNGGYKLAKVDNMGYDIVPIREGDPMPQFIQNANNQLEHSRALRESIENEIYELMEMNKAFVSGEYGGNISDDTLNSIMKGCIDRAERYWWSIYPAIKNSLYCLARLNGINVTYEEIEVIPNIGINESKKELADVSSTLINNKILSRESVRIKYYSMSKEQSDMEEEQIKLETEQPILDTTNITNTDNVKEENSNEVVGDTSKVGN